MSKLTYVKGDLFKSITGKTPILVPHICNDIGGWGSGFVVAVSKFDRTAENAYRSWFVRKQSISVMSSNLELGATQLVWCKDKVDIVNMVAQHNTIAVGEKTPIRYWALSKCMKWLADKVLAGEETNSTNAKEIWCPRFGAGLARGNWDFIETLIKEIWVDAGIPVTVFEL